MRSMVEAMVEAVVRLISGPWGLTEWVRVDELCWFVVFSIGWRISGCE